MLPVVVATPILGSSLQQLAELHFFVTLTGSLLLLGLIFAIFKLLIQAALLLKDFYSKATKFTLQL
eukprot:5835258-Amphidinium_carterae.1